MLVNRQRRVKIAVAPLAEFLDQISRELHFPQDGVAVQLVSDSAMTDLNQTFRGKRGTTDVLSFPAEAVPVRRSPPRRARSKRHGPEAQETHIGDIAIAPETARRNARRFSRGLTEELRILILHGMIHLAGYDHETDDGQMETFERRLRRKFGLSL